MKVKFNPVDIGRIHVWNHVDNEYVTLYCIDQSYAAGLSLHMHETVMAFVESENLDFNTPEDRKIARATLNAAIREAAPHAAMAHRKRMARLLETETIRNDDGEAHQPSPFSGIVHDTAIADRRDGGEPPPGPRARGRNKQGARRPTRKRQQRDDFELCTGEPLAPETGFAARVGPIINHEGHRQEVWRPARGEA